MFRFTPHFPTFLPSTPIDFPPIHRNRFVTYVQSMNFMNKLLLTFRSHCSFLVHKFTIRSHSVHTLLTLLQTITHYYTSHFVHNSSVIIRKPSPTLILTRSHFVHLLHYVTDEKNGISLGTTHFPLFSSSFITLKSKK